MLFATPKFMIQAIVAAKKLDWKPQLYLASVSIEPSIMAIARANAPDLTGGARAIAFVKNPNDPVWRKDAAVALYRSILRRFAPTAKATDVYHWYGMAVAWTMVDTLQRAGKNLTRAGLLRAARSLDTTANPFLLPGTRLRTSTGDVFPLDTVYLYRYDNRQWVRQRRPLRPRPDDQGGERHDEEVDTYVRRRARVAHRTRARGRGDRRIHLAEAVGVLRGGQRHPHRRVGRVADDATARAAIVIPNGTSITATAGARDEGRHRPAQVSALALGGALLPLAGDIVVAPPGAVPAASQAACIGTTPRRRRSCSYSRPRGRRSTSRPT